VLHDKVINSVAKPTDIVTLRRLTAKQTWESFWIETQIRSQSFLRDVAISRLLQHLQTPGSRNDDTLKSVQCNRTASKAKHVWTKAVQLNTESDGTQQQPQANASQVN